MAKQLSAVEAAEIQRQLSAARVVGDVRLAHTLESALRGTDQACVREAKQLFLYICAHKGH